jgi:hypothetical protein
MKPVIDAKTLVSRFFKETKKIDYEELANVIEQHAVDIENLEFLVLKGHLLIEHVMEIGIEAITFEKSITKRRFPFEAKVNIAHSLGLLYTIDSRDLYHEILQFNNLRNKIAHSLEYDKNELNKLFQLFPSFDKKQLNEIKDEEKRQIKMLEQMVIEICGHMIMTLELKIEIINEVNNTFSTDSFKKAASRALSKFKGEKTNEE